MDTMEACPSCGHRAEVRYGPDIRDGGMSRRMWRAQCGADALCKADTFTRFTREAAESAWNNYARSKTPNVF